MTTKHYWVYILACDNGSYYTGYTVDMQRRYAAHVAGTACKYTRSFRPLKIAQCWQVLGDKRLAMSLEARIKAMTRAQKEHLIAHPATIITDERVRSA